MAYGSCTAINVRNRLTRFVVGLIGVLDLHTHYRTRPLLAWFRALPQTEQALSLLEVGCGTGLNLLEVSRWVRVEKLEGYDLDCQSIATARQLAQQVFPHLNSQFYCEDASRKTDWQGQYDYILLIDFLEHIHQPEEALRRFTPLLKAGGKFIVSVPTPLYPKVFGLDFHRRVGHVIDGFTLESLNALFAGSACERVESSYNTGMVANVFCYLYYRYIISISNKYLKFVLTLAVHPFRVLDVANGAGRSSSLFAVYEKNRHGS
jgi:2-polyprenyl-3-methyl-5-hydroxy-6-metoxy-1,4-benzoquinol methylase